jgi:PAS domain S-box-containing protein
LKRNPSSGSKAEALLTRALKEADLQKEKFRTVVNHSPFGIALIAKDGSFTHINPKFKELFGYDEDDIPNGREWFRKAYPDPEYRRLVIAAWINDMQGAEVGEKRPRNFKVTCKQGERKIINFISVMLTTGENIVACEDITERKVRRKPCAKANAECLKSSSSCLMPPLS